MHCGQKFADDISVAEHVASAHEHLPPNSCLLCGRTCQDERALGKHMAVHESPGNMLFCSKCGKSFHNKGRFVEFRYIFLIYISNINICIVLLIVMCV